MKIKYLKKFLVINLILIAVIFSMQVSVSAKIENEDEILERLQKENEDNPESVKYLVTDENISNILPETSLENFKTNIENTIKLYENSKKEKEVTSGILKTGMLLEYTLNGRTYDISVLGDLNGDGILNQIELTREIRHILNLEKWKIEGNLQILSGDITKDKKIDLDDTEAIINYIVFDKLNFINFDKIEKPEIIVTEGKLKADRYENNVRLSIREKQENAFKTIYKITGSAEREYKTIDKTDEVKIEIDGIFKITAYTYGKDGNKSKASTNIIIIEKPTYTVKYSAGNQGIFNTLEIDKLYIGDETPKFTGEILGNPGYKFMGWNEEISERVEGNIEYIAMWEPIEYNIEYELKGGKLAEGEENPRKYTIESENFTLKKPTKIGYKFLGWSENESEDIKEDIVVEKGNYGNKKYIANWEALDGIKYTVKIYTMDINGEYKEEIIEYRGVADEEISVDTTPKTGFTYDEEKSTPTGTINPDGSTELEIYFTRNKYNIKAIAGYGINNILYKKLTEDAIVSETEILDEIYYEMPITILSNEKVGYRWSIWSSNNKELLEDSENKSYEFIMPAGEIEITAIASLKEYEIEYKLNGGSLPVGKENPTTCTIESGKLHINHPEKEGYTFEGWTINEGQEIFTEDITLPITKDTEKFKLTAIYTPNTDTLYKVIVHRMNTSGVYESEVPDERHGTTDERVSLTIENEQGFTLDTERSNTSGIILPDGSLELNVYLSRNRYNLILNKETGIEFDNCASGVYYYGESINLNTIIHQGYTWNEWRAGENTEFNSSQKERTIVMPSKDLTLTATVTVNIYHITYNLAGGIVGSNNMTEYTVETETFRLNNPSKTGYVFVGWTGSNGSSPQKEVSINRGSIGDKNYTANWRADTYTITYDANGGVGGPGSQIKTKGVNMTISSVEPSRTDYAFLGWSTSPTATTPTYRPGAIYSVDANITLYAVWRYKIITFSNGTQVNYPNNTWQTSANIPPNSTVKIKWDAGAVVGENGEARITATLGSKNRSIVGNPEIPEEIFEMTTGSSFETLTINGTVGKNQGGMAFFHVYIQTVYDNQYGFYYTLR